MSNSSSRRLRPNEAAMFAQTGGDFIEESRFVPQSGGGFVPWGKASFRALAPEELANTNEPAPVVIEERAETGESAATEATAQSAETAQAAPSQEPAAETAHAAPAPPPPPVAKETALNHADVIAEIEKAREDGRALGYQQGLTAAREELAEALAAIRKIEETLVPDVESLLEKNAVIMARHVRRIAQDLAGTVFATIPDLFIERIRKASDLFTRANAEFTLTINSQDAQHLMPALRGEELFKIIKINEDANLPKGGFRLTSRDLEMEDIPEMLGDVDVAP
jgi:flagellar assembly protein FliH